MTSLPSGDHEGTIVVSNAKAKRGRRVARRLARAFPGEWRSVSHLDLAHLPDLPPEHAERAERFVVIGGDGTIRAVAEWQWRHRIDRPLGLVPAGTGNNLVNGLGLPTDPAVAFERVLVTRPETRVIDRIVIEDLSPTGPSFLCLQSAAIGLPADVAARYDRLRERRWFRVISRPFGASIYRFLSIVALLRQGSHERRANGTTQIDLRENDLHRTIDCVAFFIGNERSLGGNFVPCPRAQVDDGKLDLCWVEPASADRYRTIFRAFGHGTQCEHDEVGYLQTDQRIDLTIEGPPRPILIDGDLPLETAHLRLRVEPRAVSIIDTRPR